MPWTREGPSNALPAGPWRHVVDAVKTQKRRASHGRSSEAGAGPLLGPYLGARAPSPKRHRSAQAQTRIYAVLARTPMGAPATFWTARSERFPSNSRRASRQSAFSVEQEGASITFEPRQPCTAHDSRSLKPSPADGIRCRSTALRARGHCAVCGCARACRTRPCSRRSRRS